MLLNGAVAVLAGAGRRNGVGATSARLLAKKGCHVLLHCLKSDHQAHDIVKECRQLGVDAEFFLGDATKETTCYQLAELVRNRWGKADKLTVWV